MPPRGVNALAMYSITLIIHFISYFNFYKENEREKQWHDKTRIQITNSSFGAMVAVDWTES